VRFFIPPSPSPSPQRKRGNRFSEQTNLSPPLSPVEESDTGPGRSFFSCTPLFLGLFDETANDLDFPPSPLPTPMQG